MALVIADQSVDVRCPVEGCDGCLVTLTKMQDDGTQVFFEGECDSCDNKLQVMVEEKGE